MFGTIFLVLFIVTPVAMGLTAAATARYTKPGLLIWRRDRLRRSTVTTIVAGMVVGGLLIVAFQDFQSSPPPYEADWLPMLVLIVLWVAMLRASAIGRGEKPETASDVAAK